MKEISKEKITVSVKNRKHVVDELIGTFDFDVTKIYLQKQHKIEHQTIALCNPEGDDHSQITGVLQVSILVKGETDELLQLNKPNYLKF
jgi:hypothetical protein